MKHPFLWQTVLILVLGFCFLYADEKGTGSSISEGIYTATVQSGVWLFEFKLELKSKGAFIFTRVQGMDDIKIEGSKTGKWELIKNTLLLHCEEEIMDGEKSNCDTGDEKCEIKNGTVLYTLDVGPKKGTQIVLNKN